VSHPYDADVVIIGAGPVGLSAAMALDAQGVSTIIVEERPYLRPPSVKSNHVSSRTMEAFRRLGVARKVRDAGLPPDYPNDVSFRTTLVGEEIGRIPIPARQDRYTSTAGPDTGWSTPEPPHRINQSFLEPVLLEHAATLPNVSLMNLTRFQHFEQSADGVEIVVSDIGNTNERTLRALFLIGADGGRSKIRKQIQARFEGDATIQNVMSTYIRAVGLYDLMPGKRAWSYYTFNTRRNGHVYAVNGQDTFLIHSYLTAEEAETASVDRDASIRAILGVDNTFHYEILTKEDWVARRLVANRFHDGRVFIAGDAAHLWVPYAGYGMNAGIADALNLSWLLAAHLHGWAGQEILEAYEAERQPITAQVSRFAMSHAEEIMKARETVPSSIEDDSSEGKNARQRIGQEAYELNVEQFAAEGLNYGYVYDKSPIIAYDGEDAPGYTMGTYTPSTVPGCRAPHFWLEPNVSLYDKLGSGYTLLRLDQNIDISTLINAAAKVKMPLKTIDVMNGQAPAAYRHALVICREDQHIAWRGDRIPADVELLVDHLRGARTPYSMNNPIG